ncbi:S1 RNA-binding domain-containing protein [Patescibacteria group bacterium]|nr:S1 RNA-binding domain-containing protein [Patescibacteria group bacterium]MBU1016338.1 S1 RNA-binding domain-containing protein [Patescibacteria group bacterium]MBU1685041.1 S1 RNA-binding domain-containing protein [Patescibacteria group bacterium]MBU1938849.1 S1 RNA-binding domain-containing protein [Patescibacteria group bacterium]
MFKITDDNISMEDLLNSSVDFEKPKLGAVITGKVVSVAKNRLVVDLNGVAVGISSGRETHDSSDTISDLKEGDEVKTVVIEEENEDGMVVLSLKRAAQTTTWDRFDKAYKDGDIIDVTIAEANKGGLMIDVDGIKGFIPVSQLAPAHYPRVEDANSTQILSRLQKLVGIKLNVKIINLDRGTGKMILSERAAQQGKAKASLGELKVGDRVKGRVSGVVKFGIFVTFDGLEGLVHISEIAWGHVSNPHQYAKVGDEVEVEIIGIENEKLSLSMKRLIPDPWSVIEEKYPIGSKVKGTINRFSPFGAFVQLEDDINGLIHLSEISDQKVEDPADFLDVGQEVEAEVINIDRDEHRIGLSLKSGKSKAAKKKSVKAEEKITEKEEEKAAVAEVKEEAEEKPKKKAAAKKEKVEKLEEEVEEKEEKPKKKPAAKKKAPAKKKADK